MVAFSKWLTEHEAAQNPEAINRIKIAMSRLPNVLEKQIVASQRTLEQKISDQGPNHLRVDPHLVGLAITELINHRGILKSYKHPSTIIDWYGYAKTDEEIVTKKLDELAPLHAQVSAGNFPNFIGDALEVIVYKALKQLNEEHPRHSFDGAFDLEGPKRTDGRYKKTDPPLVLSGNRTNKPADFILHGFEHGSLCIECKNKREWVYPNHGIVKELIKNALELDTTPVLIARRIHYTTIRNLLEPAGIIAHETYYQYYPATEVELADRVRDKRSLGYSDVRATEDLTKRTLKFWKEDLLLIADKMSLRFRQNKEALSEYVNGEKHLAQLYNAIGSPAAGNWQDELPKPDEY